MRRFQKFIEQQNYFSFTAKNMFMIISPISEDGLFHRFYIHTRAKS